MSGPSGFDRHQINAEDIQIGTGVEIHPTAVITGYKGPAKQVVLGDHCVIGENVRIMVSEFSLGDYSKLNAGAYSYGKAHCLIGRNCWFGGGVVLDAQGGISIEDNCTIGADSKVWSHFLGGDWVAGGAFDKAKAITIHRDAWIGCDCVVTKDVASKAMFLPATVACFASQENHTYSGNPMRDMTEVLGPQFRDIPASEKAYRLQVLRNEFLDANPQYSASDLKHFEELTNTYTKLGTEAEVAFIKASMPRLRMLPNE